MLSVDIRQAKSQLSKLVERAATRGEAFIIAKAGKPLVKVVPFDASEKPRKRIGFLKGRFEGPDDLKEIGRDAIADSFEGEG